MFFLIAGEIIVGIQGISRQPGDLQIFWTTVPCVSIDLIGHMGVPDHLMSICEYQNI